jgi:O-acetyl-ADP-ribose deacetylase (regulator of RNase III)
MVAEEGLHSVAFPSISTGAYGYPKREAATIAVTTVSDFLQEKSSLSEVRFVVFSEEDLRVYEAALAQCAHFPRGNE